MHKGDYKVNENIITNVGIFIKDIIEHIISGKSNKINYLNKKKEVNVNDIKKQKLKII